MHVNIAKSALEFRRVLLIGAASFPVLVDLVAG